MVSAAGIRDSSAPRAIQRQAEIQTQVQLAQLNLSLMQFAHCSPPDDPFDFEVYAEAASTCARARAASLGALDPEPCVMSRRKPLHCDHRQPAPKP
jgi:hypothetical protein